MKSPEAMTHTSSRLQGPRPNFVILTLIQSEGLSYNVPSPEMSVSTRYQIPDQRTQGQQPLGVEEAWQKEARRLRGKSK